MSIKSRSELKQVFTTGAKPTQQNFSDWLDSYKHTTDLQQPALATVPAPVNGDLWYHTVQNQFQGTRNGAAQNFLMGNDAILNQDTTSQNAAFKINGASTIDVGSTGYAPLSLKSNIHNSGTCILFSAPAANDRILGYGIDGTDTWGFQMASGFQVYLKPGLLDFSGTTNRATMGIETRNYMFGSTASDSDYDIGPGSFFIYDKISSQYRMGINSAGNVIFGGYADNGGKLQVNGGALKLSADTADYPLLPGGLQYRSDVGKSRISDGRSWANIATEDWVTFRGNAGNLLIVDANAVNATDTRSGSDARNISIPYKTIEAAAAVAGHRDIIYVRGGSYNPAADIPLNCLMLHIDGASIVSNYKLLINTQEGLENIYIKCTGGSEITIAAVESVYWSTNFTLTGDGTAKVICTNDGYNINVHVTNANIIELLQYLKANIAHERPLTMTRVKWLDGHLGTRATYFACEGTSIQYTGGALFDRNTELGGSTIIFLACNIVLTNQIVDGQFHPFHLYIYNTTVNVSSVTSGTMQGAEVRIVNCPAVGCSSFLFSIGGTSSLMGRHQVINSQIYVGTDYLFPGVSGALIIVKGITTNATAIFSDGAEMPQHVNVNDATNDLGVTQLF